MADYTHLSVALPDGGRFTSTWPVNAGAGSLQMMRTMFTMTMELWVEKVARNEAAEAEYASWFKEPGHG
jgi:hypothetical protein